MNTEQSDLRAIWPGWSFWTSRHGVLLCATRRRALSDRETRRGLARTLIADDPADLRAQLDAQEAIELAHADPRVRARTGAHHGAADPAGSRRDHRDTAGPAPARRGSADPVPAPHGPAAPAPA